MAERKLSLIYLGHRFEEGVEVAEFNVVTTAGARILQVEKGEKVKVSAKTNLSVGMEVEVGDDADR